MSVNKIVITGGPCAGKTTVMSRLTGVFTERGYKVLVVPEGATELIPNGIIPGMKGMSMEEFQEVIIRKQLDKEELYDIIAENLSESYDKILILFDRGLMDGQAYVSQEAFDKVLNRFMLSRSEAFGRYDGVLHLVTAAMAEDTKLYTTANNAARFESAEEACRLDALTLEAWVGHPHLRAIQPQEDFEKKIDVTIKEVCAILGDPEPVELEHKFLIKRPNDDAITELAVRYGAKKSTIVQSYLDQVGDTERRVRQRRMNDGGAIYTYTEKEQREDGKGRTERERTITEKEYCNFLLSADCRCPTLIKNRYCFMYKGSYMELDIYPGSEDYAILEVEVSDLDEAVDLPPELQVVKEVTGDKDYYNKAIALRNNRLPDTKEEER